MKKKILITGVAGFIGSSIAKKFLDKGFKVFGVDNLSSGNLSNIPRKVEFIKFIMPPLIAICSLILFSSAFIYFHNPIEDKEKNELIN